MKVIETSLMLHDKMKYLRPQKKGWDLLKKIIQNVITKKS